MGIEKVIEQVLEHGEEDWVPICAIPYFARSAFGELSSEDVRDVSIRAIRALLEGELAQVGDLTKAGFVPWELDVDSAVREIEHEWIELGHEPGLGELPWLDVTGKG